MRQNTLVCNIAEYRPIFNILLLTDSARDLDLDLGSGQTAYRHASVIDLYLRAKFHEIEEFFCVRADVRTYIPMDI